ncbi:hypothetical protein [Bartonella raoultii]|uniref:hypothetical protein n=1 Tax=Bartonella raoultii TaxID=1457020 RepID=UPI001ABA5DFD|nr:hypothetical protein [Bartonella raoultii]
MDVGAKLVQCAGFCLDIVERYSAVSSLLRSYISEYNLEPIRCTFHWGNDRLWDCRPTSGVSSKIIHPYRSCPINLQAVLGFDKVIALESDFAVGSAFKLVSAFILAQLGAEAICAGYSSFVNVITKRTLSFIFRGGEGGVVLARVVYDDPDWDHDYIKIWEKDKECAPLLEKRVVGSASGAVDYQIIKLMRQVEDVVIVVKKQLLNLLTSMQRLTYKKCSRHK